MFKTGTSKSPVLQLLNVIRTGKHQDAQVFTFVIPSQLSRGFLHNANSKEFSFKGHSWFLRLEYYNDPLDAHGRRGSFAVQYQKQPLGVSLHISNMTSGMKVQLQHVRFSLLHPEHYSRNLMHEETSICFTSANPSVKVSRWIEPGFLSNEKYLLDDYTCLLELEVQGAMTTYEEQLRMPRDTKEALRCVSLESNGFTYAHADWCIIITWPSNGDRSKSGENISTSQPKLVLQRNSKSKHWTHIRFRVAVNWQDHGVFNIGPADHLLSPESGATTEPALIGETNTSVFGGGAIIGPKCKISLFLELHVGNSVSRASLIPTAPQGMKNCSRVSDPEGFQWIVMSDILGSLVRLRVYPDPENIVLDAKSDSEPMSMTRSSCFSAQLIPFNSTMSIVQPNSNFYTIHVPLIKKSPSDDHLSCEGVSQDIVLNLDVEKVSDIIDKSQLIFIINRKFYSFILVTFMSYFEH